MSPNLRPKHVAVVAAAALLAIGSAGCSTTADDADAAADSDTAASDSFVDELAKGYESAVPTEGPGPAAGKSVWWVSCGESVPDCSVPSSTAAEAAEELGFDFHIADGKLNAGGGNASAIRTALAANPDAIIVHGFSCSAAKQALEEAKQADVLVLGVEAIDCSDSGDGEKLFTADMLYSDTAKTALDYFNSWGVLAAKYLIGATGEEAQVIDNAGVEPLMKIVDDSFLATLGECADCEIVDTVNFGSPDYGPNGTWIQQFRSTLAQNPTANAAYIPFDANLSFSGGPQAVKDSGLDMVTVGGTGGSAGMDLVRAGDLTAVTGAHDVQWMAYAAMDNINRALNGEPAVTQGVGSVAVDKAHGLPEEPGTNYQSSVDWKSAYERLWSQ